jgi:hypothetical protein
MRLPALAHWETTRDGLHQASQVLKQVRLLVADPLPHSLHYSLQVVPQGISTGVLPSGGELALDFQRSAVSYRRDGSAAEIPLAGHSLASLAPAVSEMLRQAGIELSLPYEKLNEAALFQIDPALAADYAHVLYSVFTATARFRARLLGSLSPIVIWPHHFDLSFLWFATQEASEQAPHMNFGFAPFSPGLERPYLYAYAWPIPSGLLDLKLPAPGYWHTTGWTGVVIPYDEIAKSSDPEGIIEDLQYTIFKKVSPLLG